MLARLNVAACCGSALNDFRPRGIFKRRPNGGEARPMDSLSRGCAAHIGEALGLQHDHALIESAAL